MADMQLAKRNWQAAGAHTLCFMTLLVLYLYYKNSQKFAEAETFRYALPTPDDINSTCNSNRYDSNGEVGKCSKDVIYAVPKKTSLRFNIIYGCLFFFGFTALAHLFYATDGFNTGAYTSVVKSGWNPYRWVEYGISASAMTLLIGYSLGTKDAATLMSLLFATASLQTVGYVVESSIKAKNLNRESIIAATVGGWLLLGSIWGPIVYNFKNVIKDIKDNYSNEIDPSTGQPVKLPSWLWFIILVQIINFSGFGVIQLNQVRRALGGNPKPFSEVEMQYLFLSFAGKIGLASGLSYGLLFRTRDCA